MTSNPLRKARKKLRVNNAKYELNPSPELKQEIEKWEEKINTLIKCQVKAPSKKEKIHDKTDDQLFNEARVYNRNHRNDSIVKEKEQNLEKASDLEKNKEILRKNIHDKSESEKKKYEEELEKYKKEKEEFESMKEKSIKEIMEKENVNKHKAFLRFKEEYDKVIQYNLIIKEIMEQSNCSQEEAENLFKQISLRNSHNREKSSQIEDEPIPE
jgi:hypothetical protein